MDNYNRLIKYYEHFVQKTYSNPNFEYNPISKDIAIIKKFAKILDNPSLGDDWLFNYMSFQFKYWSEKTYKRISTVVASYVFGAKAIERFEQRTEQSDYFTKEFARTYQININDLTNTKYYQKDLINTSPKEEIEKRRVLGGFDRLLNCIEHTTLFNIKSEICMLCLKSNTCKTIQKNKFPEIYRLRNEKNISKRETAFAG